MNDKDFAAGEFKRLLNEIDLIKEESEHELSESEQYYNSLFPGVCPNCGGPINNGEVEFLSWCGICEEKHMPNRKYYFNEFNGYGHHYGAKSYG